MHQLSVSDNRNRPDTWPFSFINKVEMFFVLCVFDYLSFLPSTIQEGLFFCLQIFYVLIWRGVANWSWQKAFIQHCIWKILMSVVSGGLQQLANERSKQKQNVKIKTKLQYHADEVTENRNDSRKKSQYKTQWSYNLLEHLTLEEKQHIDSRLHWSSARWPPGKYGNRPDRLSTTPKRNIWSLPQ